MLGSEKVNLMFYRCTNSYKNKSLEWKLFHEIQVLDKNIIGSYLTCNTNLSVILIFFNFSYDVTFIITYDVYQICFKIQTSINYPKLIIDDISANFQSLLIMRECLWSNEFSTFVSIKNQKQIFQRLIVILSILYEGFGRLIHLPPITTLRKNIFHETMGKHQIFEHSIDSEKK